MTPRDELRAQMKRRREAIGAAERLEMSAQIGELVLAMEEYQRARRVMCYWALPTEVQTARLIGEMLRSGKAVYLPVTGKKRSMKAVRLQSIEALHSGAFGVMEPEGEEVIDAEALDLIFVPGLAFDREGGRIGYGAGYYDRFLPACTGRTVALTTERQMVEHVPMEAHDVYMDCIVTERMVYRITCPKNESETSKNGKWK